MKQSVPNEPQKTAHSPAAHSLTPQEPVVQAQANHTGMPDNLKTGIENLSGYSLDNVKVHYNSSKPAQLQAHAYAQGTDIHLAPGQEKHLPHEAWHVIQQKQGRVRPTTQLKGKTPVNDDSGLEREADIMGAKALSGSFSAQVPALLNGTAAPVVQRVINARTVKEFIEEQIRLQTEQQERGAEKEEQTAAFSSVATPLVAEGSGEEKPEEKEKKSDHKKYTTLGFEHEFAQMQDGKLRGVSHLELAVIGDPMPLTGLTFVLETDAGNSMEMVSPPFLFETHPDVPIPLPEDVEYVDTMIEKELRRHTHKAGITLGQFMQNIAAEWGLNFHWKTKKKVVPMERKNMSFNTDPSVHKGILKNTAQIKPKDLEQITIGPSNKGSGSIGGDFKGDASGEDATTFNNEGAVISQANFATDALVADLVRRRGREQGGNFMTEYLEHLRDYFREQTFTHTFDKEIEQRQPLIDDLLVFREQILEFFRKHNVNATARGRADKDRVLSDVNDLIRKIQMPQLDKRSKTLTDAIERLRHRWDIVDAGIKAQYLAEEIEPKHTDSEASDSEEKPAEKEKLADRAENLLNRIGAMPEIGAESPNLRIFLNQLSRSLAGQFVLPAQAGLKKAQQERFSSIFYKEKMQGDQIKVHAGMSSHVKDVDQGWIKENIINFGMGILSPAEWRRVAALIAKDGPFRAELLEDTAPTASLDARVHVGIRETMELYRNQLLKQIMRALDILAAYIEQKELGTDMPEDSPVGPRHTPDFMSHDPDFIDPRQDTFLRKDRVQLPQYWEDRDLFVLESRWDSVHQIKDIWDMYEEHYGETDPSEVPGKRPVNPGKEETPEQKEERRKRREEKAKQISERYKSSSEDKKDPPDSKRYGKALDPLARNNCLITAMNGGHQGAQADVTMIRFLLREELNINYGEMLHAGPEEIHTIATVLNINDTLVRITMGGHEQRFVIAGGNVIEIQGDEDQDGLVMPPNEIRIRHTGGNHFVYANQQGRKKKTPKKK